MNKYTIDQIKSVMDKNGYQFFETGNYNINTIGIRSTKNDSTGEMASDIFNDMIVVAYKINDAWKAFYYEATTIPGKWYFEHPMNAQFGTAVMVPGQYKGAYILGYHFSKPALQQVGKIKLYRDQDKNDVLDLDIDSIQEVDWSGINIHYSISGVKNIGKWSAGCQVLQYSPESKEYLEFLSHFRIAINNGYKNRFTYTLLLEKDFA